MKTTNKGNILIETLLALMIISICASIAYSLMTLYSKTEEDRAIRLNNRYWCGVIRWSVYHKENPLVDITY